MNDDEGREPILIAAVLLAALAVVASLAALWLEVTR